MRILLSGPHRYPSDDGIGVGLRPKLFASGSAYKLQDLIARGLGELGHTVFYLPQKGAARPLPREVTLVDGSIPRVDILHSVNFEDDHIARYIETLHTPWVTTCHADVRLNGRSRRVAARNWIFVSRALARLHGRKRYVLNGLDPAEYTYSETKDDYILFLSSMHRAIGKGLDLALSLARKKGFHLVVAGTALTDQDIQVVAKLCEGVGAKYLGDVRGSQKAELLAGAKALLFPSRLEEGFGLSMVEALMSGTPVICSDNGACPEVISRDVGFLCSSYEDYLDALDRLDEVEPRACREKAVNEFHYLRMAREYAKEYEKEVNRDRRQKLKQAVEVIRAYGS
jgi:glycosyltransferase involved in cell wall biosynthesis